MICPVCDMETLEADGIAACPACGWVADPDAAYVPEQGFRKNVMSLLEAKEHWRLSGKTVE